MIQPAAAAQSLARLPKSNRIRRRTATRSPMLLPDQTEYNRVGGANVDRIDTCVGFKDGEELVDFALPRGAAE